MPMPAAMLAALLALAPALAAAQDAAPAPLASQDTNTAGVVADVTELKRKGNSLTAKVKVRNTGSADAEYSFTWENVYVLDADAGKKYEVLKDDQGVYVAANNPGWKDRFYGNIEPGQAVTAWMKFPAPPAECKTVTLTLPGMPPFEDLPIQDL